jgi:hypothetical protein
MSAAMSAAVDVAFELDSCDGKAAKVAKVANFFGSPLTVLGEKEDNSGQQCCVNKYTIPAASRFGLAS